MSIHDQLIHAVTDFDRRSSRGRSYNPYALGHYMLAVDRAAERVEAGATWAEAIGREFNDRIRDRLLTVVEGGEAWERGEA
jgi:hypothetical protein